MSQQILESLKQAIRAIEGGPSLVQRTRVHSGVYVLDSLLGGLPRPGVVECAGELGGGATHLAAQMVASITSAGDHALWVDTTASLYPPYIESQGVALNRCVVVRPPAPVFRWAGWVAEQAIRSGCFPLVVIDVPEGLATQRVGYPWARASEQGGCTVVALTSRSLRWLPADVRLLCEGELVTVTRNRAGRAGQGDVFRRFG